MVRERWMCGSALAALVVLLGAGVVFADDLGTLAPPDENFEGIQGLEVSLYQGDTLIGSPVTTDGYGRFLLGSLAAGQYRLLAESVDKTLSLSFPLTVPAGDPPVPFNLEGYVYGRPDLAVGYLVKARLFAGDLTITKVKLVPRKWDLNKTDGTVNVLMYGDGLDAISKVTLTTKVASLSTTEIVIDPVQTKGTASFARAEVFATLVPPTAKDGDRLEVEVTIEAGGSAPQIYNREIVVLR